MTAEINDDAIAAKIHGFYCEQSVKEGWHNDFPMPFDELPEFMKEDNRAAARRIAQVLSLAGLQIAPRSQEHDWTTEQQEEISKIIQQNIDLLAEGEHDGWMQARLRQGWRRGPCKDVAKRESHLLVPYSELVEQIEKKQQHEKDKHGKAPTKTIDEEVESEKNKDRDSVRNYVPIIAMTEFQIVPMGGNSSP